MDRTKCAILIAIYHFKKWIINPRIYVIFICVFLYLHSILSPILSFCYKAGHNITPYLFPYIMCHPITVTLLMLATVLLFCDAPFIGAEQPYIIMRSGRNPWVWGSVIYIACASVVFFFLTILFTIIILLPVIEFSLEWGKVIGTFAQTSLASQVGLSIPFSQIIFTHYSPLKAMILAFANSCFISFVLGMIIFVLNLNYTRFIGTLGAIIPILWQMTVTKTWVGFIKLSPVSWVSLSNIDTSSTTLYPTIRYVYAVLATVIAITIYLSLHLMGKKDIQVLKTL